MKNTVRSSVREGPTTFQRMIKTWIGMGAVFGFSLVYIFSLPELQVKRIDFESETLYYEIYVHDENTRFNEESLQLIIVSDNDIIEIDLVRGQNQGVVNLLPDIRYEISLVGSVGFGVKTWETYIIENNHILFGKGE